MEHDSPTLLFTLGCEYLISARTVRPGVTMLAKMVAAARTGAGALTYEKVVHLLTEQMCSDLDRLLTFEAQRSGPCHQPQTGLLFLVSGAPEISPKTGLATDNGVKPNLLTCANAPLWGW